MLNLRLLGPVSGAGQGDPALMSTLAVQILANSKIELATSHASKVSDHAAARTNVVRALFERAADRSQYGTAKGGSVSLDVRLMRALIELSRYYSFAISEIAGGSHSKPSSRHYAGVAFDAPTINGYRVGPRNPYFRDFLQDCRTLGATEVLGPGDPGHDHHVHAAWPRH